MFCLPPILPDAMKNPNTKGVKSWPCELFLRTGTIEQDTVCAQS